MEGDSSRPSRETTPSALNIASASLTTPTGSVKTEDPRSVPNSERKRKAEEPDVGTVVVAEGLEDAEGGGGKRPKQEEGV